MSETNATTATIPAFGSATPILPVRNREASIDFYVKVLGFKVDLSGRFASVSCDRCGLFLSEGDQGNPGVWVWIGVGDVEAVLKEYKKGWTTESVKSVAEFLGVRRV